MTKNGCGVKSTPKTTDERCCTPATVHRLGETKERPGVVILSDGRSALVSWKVVKKSGKREAFVKGATIRCDVNERGRDRYPSIRPSRIQSATP